MRTELDRHLKQVSRSFYLSIRLLPHRLRTPIAVGYALCRAADTIADTDLLPADARLPALREFSRTFPNGASVPKAVLDAYRSLPDSDRKAVEEVVREVTAGMEMDLTMRALDRWEDLDRYIDHVAGAPGRFWTRILFAHLSSLRGADPDKMERLTTRFGKGLQLTNIIRDLAADLSRGRCYLPADWLKEEGLAPEDLLRPEKAERARHLLSRAISEAVSHLDAGLDYLFLIPQREFRVRLAVALPLFFAWKTLRKILGSDPLNPARRVKIARSSVYGTIAMLLFALLSNRLLFRYYARVRRTLPS